MVEAGSSGDIARRDDRWSESIAVGTEGFIEQVKIELGLRAQHREVLVAKGLYTLREPVPPCSDHFDTEDEALRPNNPVSWQTNLETIKPYLVRPQRQPPTGIAKIYSTPE